ncbi:MAG: hypothetical protein KDB61_13295, partial [Planctomycetes bacterium]|nr:hypothetical protein [Planctomycetota bacterium]
ADQRLQGSEPAKELLSYHEASGLPTILTEPVGDEEPAPVPESPPGGLGKAKPVELVSPVSDGMDAPVVPEQNTVEPPTAPAGDPTVRATPLSDEAPCRYGNLTGPGKELRGVLGPCMGPWNESTGMVAGGFRHGGERYCRHHLIVAKDLGGSVERARNVAQYAEKEGLLPPLVRLRVEHGAADLLQDRVGKWVESGFEAGLSGDHSVTRGAEADEWIIESWVRLQPEPGSQAHLRNFHMRVQLAALRGQDQVLEFRWIEGE